MSPFSAWDVYYTITGSSAAALTGLLFVVSTLVAGQERERETVSRGVENYTSPIVLHFCIALLLSGICAAPWPGIVPPSILVVLGGAFGLFYAARLLVRLSAPSAYLPDADDRFWYAMAPVIVYAAVISAGYFIATGAQWAFFLLAGAVLALIFLGIRNAWDTVTFITIESVGRKE